MTTEPRRTDATRAIDPPLAQASEPALLRRYASSRDPAIRDELVERFMPLARSLALRYRNGSEPLDDLVQVASLGLLKALDRFDPERRTDFAAFAAPTVLGELRHYFRDSTWSVHLPRALQEQSQAIARATDGLRGELQRSPSVAEVAERCELEVEQVLDALHADRTRRTVSLDMPTARDDAESVAMVETIGSEETGYEGAEADAAVVDAPLEGPERAVLALRFERGLSQSQVGRRIGVSQMQVSRLQRRALKKLLATLRGEDREAARAAARAA